MLDNLTGSDLVEIIKALGTLVAAIGSVFAVLSSRKNNAGITEARKEIKEVHETTNGKMAELIAANKAAAMIAGREEGRAAERDRAGNGNEEGPSVTVRVQSTDADAKIGVQEK